MNETLHPTLFKMDSKGKIRQWEIWLTHDDSVGMTTMFTRSGILDSPNQVTSSKDILPSKVKSHATRARDLANGKHKRKREAGYCDTVAGAEAFILTRPMLSKTLKVQDLGGVRYPVILQPKLDGVRAILKGDSTEAIGRLQSRKDKPFFRVPHIERHLKDHEVFLDGEIYRHGMKLQDIVHFLKTSEAETPGKLGLTYVLFDMPTLDGAPYSERLSRLLDWYEGLSGEAKESIKILSFIIAKDQVEAAEYLVTCISLGYEGMMVKEIAAPYHWDKRTAASLKVKPVYDAEFLIVRVGCDADGCIMFVCKTEDGKEFEVAPAWAKNFRRNEWNDNRESYRGKLLTVEYRSLTASGIPFHAIGKTVRDYE